MSSPDDPATPRTDGEGTAPDGLGEHDSVIPWPDPDPLHQIDDLVDQVRDPAETQPSPDEG